MSDLADQPRPPSAREGPFELAVGPPPEAWDDWVEVDGSTWPDRSERHYRCVPTICFNCESACGLLAFVDKSDGRIRKFEGNPAHPGSRGRTCAKGPATINQVHDPERILHPLKRVGPRGAGRFERVTWDAALDEIARRIRKALQEQRHDEVMYHVGRPGEDHFIPRMLQAWGVDGHNSHTNVCSAAARTGYMLWSGADRPSPDYENARFILLISSHLETGHYFNPHAQRIQAARQSGARLAAVDVRLSNTAGLAEHWISPWPGSEGALLLAIARRLLEMGAVDREYMRRWTNWEEYLEATDAGAERSFERFERALLATLSPYTPEFVAQECRIDPAWVGTLADEIAAAGTRFASHLWRSAASGNLGGWQIARCLMLLHVLTGSYGRPGGVNPNAWDKFTPKPSHNPPPGHRWNELIWPREWPLAHYEMSQLLPYLLEDQERRLEVYFTRVYNPIWTNPDGFAWIRMLEDEARVGCHVALTPIWSETAQWADFVLPMGLGPERHDVMSQETHAGTWIGFRQPVLREYLRCEGREVGDTREANPGEVWEEAEFWIALTWRIDPDGSMGLRRWYESQQAKGVPVSVPEYFGDLLSHGVPGLKDRAAAEGKTALDWMRRYGAYEVPYKGQERYEREGFKTPSRKLELWSSTLAAWGHRDQALPGYVRSHVHWSALDEAAGEMALVPTFRVPTLIHTRSGNAKWLQELSHTNPLWIHPGDAERIGVKTGDLVRVCTPIGYFVPRAWVTEGMRPGVVACSHHVGRWRLFREVGGQRQASSLSQLIRDGETLLLRQQHGAQPFQSADPDTGRVWWEEVGVHQNLCFPVQPDPVSGMHCWHQKVRVEVARPGDRFGDVLADGAKAREHYRAWLALATPGPGPGGLRRPLWLNRPLRPTDEAYRVAGPSL